ncbi:FAD/NAD(P)-binding domain-containing protein [Trichoderma reesei RUT C-30]|uniref:FAD/NAD(P)-binding domain-containing protein n=1 Tax=Hypocrea jecorina (strain ATCC 56765 / BCRC 32924 / NRRL 11460 / Rut C-30) TaxID=1344414 RepID=A0A024RZ10_HYPJR|nr:FAD/NAD(P)-binding domain-containing protein [Trichoderma reesei RUT C-30]
MEEPRRHRVAVIGLGAMGIVAVKNLLEEGFDVVGFERSSYSGGLWHFTEDEDTLSIIESTAVNVSIDRASYTDFPFPVGTPTFCTAKHVQDYLEAYVDHFHLRPHFRLSTVVTSISRDQDSGRWRVNIEEQPSEWFDKVVVATGPHIKPMMPAFEGADLFTGRLIHSKGFKKPEAFAGQRVVVVGLGNTGSDIADALVGHASNISISHHHGAVIMPRLLDGVPATSRISYRFIQLQGIINRWVPTLAEIVYNKAARQIMRDAFGEVDPAWRLDPALSVLVANPVVSDTLIANFRSKAISSITGIRRFTGGRRIELTSGETIEADAVICCTGYKNDFSLLDKEYDPSSTPSISWLKAPGSKDRPYPRLYQNVFSMTAPDSLAFLGCVWFVTGAFCLADIASMCIAQVWSGKASLPPQPEMQQWVDKQEKRICALAWRGAVIPATVPPSEWLSWADQTAGMGVGEHVGWGWKGWLFWWRERTLWRMVMDGPFTSVFWRLFPGRRKCWDGARAEIMRVNREVEERRAKAKLAEMSNDSKFSW